VEVWNSQKFGLREHNERPGLHKAPAQLTLWWYKDAAWAANPSPSSAATTTPQFQIPAQANIQLTDLGSEALSNTLGAECVKSPVQVIVLNASEERMDVISIPTESCNLARFTIVDGITGALEPNDSVQLATPATTKGE
jgi:hypothetical protein